MASFRKNAPILEFALGEARYEVNHGFFTPSFAYRDQNLCDRAGNHRSD
jgi:hypothetical protein